MIDEWGTPLAVARVGRGREVDQLGRQRQLAVVEDADNDAGGITTYSLAGARFGYLPLWTLLPITLLLIVTQEMCSRMGAVTDKGLSDLIREEFGLRTTFVMMAVLVLFASGSVLRGLLRPVRGGGDADVIAVPTHDEPGEAAATSVTGVDARGGTGVAPSVWIIDS